LESKSYDTAAEVRVSLRIQSELLGLRWPHVDLDRQQLHITTVHSKNGKGRVLPLTDGITATLRTMHATATSDLIFPGRVGRFCHRFKTHYFAALHRAKLAGLGIGIYTCRHSWASRMIEPGRRLGDPQRLGWMGRPVPRLTL
jgi:integrase